MREYGFKIPRPEDSEPLSEQQLYERHFKDARIAIERYPEVVARVLAELWLQNTMQEMFRSMVP